MEFLEVVEDMGSNVKKTFKNKPFLIVCIIVGLIALIMWYIREHGSSVGSADSYQYYDGEAAIGYGGYGYPSSGGGGSYSEDYWQTKLENLEENMGLLGEKHSTELETLDGKWQERYESLLDKLDNNDDDGAYVDSYSPTTGMVTYSNHSVIDQMKANSNAYHVVTSTQEREELHAANMELGASIGATYDAKTGTWWKDGALLYSLNSDTETPVVSTGTKKAANSNVYYDSNVDYQAKVNDAILSGQGAAVINSYNAQRNAKIEDSGKTVKEANVTYDKNVDYQALINKAKAQGADQSVIDNLTAQREAKIKGENLTQYK